MIRYLRRLFPVAVVLLQLSTPVSADVQKLVIPVTFDSHFIQQVLDTTLFRPEKQPLSVWGDVTGCNDLSLESPTVSIVNNALHITLDATATTGVVVGQRCINLISWQGKIDTIQEATVVNRLGRIAFKTTDSSLLTVDGQPAQVSSKIWNLAKSHVHPTLDTFNLSFIKALTDLRRTLSTFLPSAGNSEVLKSLLLHNVRVVESGLQADLEIELDNNDFTADVAVNTLPLSQADRQTFIETWDRWDGFVSFIVKTAARRIIQPDARETLLETLVDARYSIVQALDDSVDTAANDQLLRQAFVRLWQNLAPVFRAISGQMQGAQALGFLSFIAASDALLSIDHFGKNVGWTLSVDGLRTMAHMLDSEQIGDPLDTPERLDPEIRELFEFGPPLPAPPAVPTAPDEESWPAFSLRLFMQDANANIASPEKHDDLNQMLVSRSNLQIYLPLVRELLNDTSQRTLDKHSLDTKYHELFRQLTLATAWQETCWRQYETRKGRVVTIKSWAGALGMMQIMPIVWRGFYETDSLANNISYNAAAGSEILHRYLVRYALRKEEHLQPGGIDNLVKASYAAYNGGPRQLNRYRKSTTKATLQEIDQSFWAKFEQIRSGDELAVISCY